MTKAAILVGTMPITREIFLRAAAIAPRNFVAARD